jgi:hypothetical protein
MDAATELLRAMLDALRATASVNDVLEGRIFDRQPGRNGSPVAAYPHLSLGPTTSLPDDFDCLDGEEITIQLDVWTSGDNSAFASTQCREISDAIKRRLHNAELPLTVNALVTLTWAGTRILDDPNPAIRHGAVQFTATVETP